MRSEQNVSYLVDHPHSATANSTIEKKARPTRAKGSHMTFLTPEGMMFSRRGSLRTAAVILISSSTSKPCSEARSWVGSPGPPYESASPTDGRRVTGSTRDVLWSLIL